MRALQSTRPLPHAPHLAACSYSVFTVQSVHIPAKITGCVRDSGCPACDDAAAAGTYPVVVHIEAAIDNADEDEELPLAPWH